MNTRTPYTGTAVLFLLLLLGSGMKGWAQPVGPSQPLVFSADSLVTSTIGTEEVNILWGNAKIDQGVVHIEADKAVLYSGTNRAVLTGNVRVTQPGAVMTAPRAEYEGNTRLSTAPDGMTLQEEGATLRAGWGTYNMYSRIAQFRNGVVLEDGKSTLRAASGDYFSVERRAVFVGGVRVESDSGTITSHNLTYWRDSRESFAVGDVVLISDKHSARLTGDTIRNRPADGYTIATGLPKLVQVDTIAAGDSVRHDTTVVTALKLEAFRSGREEYVATDSARLRRGTLEAIAGVARFIMDDSIIALGPRLLGPSADTIVTGGKPRPDTTAANDSGNAGGTHNEQAGNPPVRRDLYPVVWYDKSQLTGDTITVGLTERKLRTIDVMGDAFAVTEGAQPLRYDQLAATRLLFDVLRDTIRSVRAQGLASSIYFMYDAGTSTGVNRTSGDTINVTFDQGQASNIGIIGRRSRSEGEYFPEQFVAGQETAYRLEGFRWLGRDGSVMKLNSSLPKAPPVPKVPPQEGGGTISSRPR